MLLPLLLLDLISQLQKRLQFRSSSKKKKKWNFFNQCLTKYKWLHFSLEIFIYCDTFTKYNKIGTSLYKSNKWTNFQHSAITRHVLSKEHQSCLNIPAPEKDLQWSMVKLDSQQDKAALVLFKNHSLDGLKRVPLLKFELLYSFLTDWSPRSLISTAKSNSMQFIIYNWGTAVQYRRHCAHRSKNEGKCIPIRDCAHRLIYRYNQPQMPCCICSFQPSTCCDANSVFIQQVQELQKAFRK